MNLVNLLKYFQIFQDSTRSFRFDVNKIRRFGLEEILWASLNHVKVEINHFLKEKNKL